MGRDKINPERIEHVLMSYPAVAQAGVAGVTDHLGIERLSAAVVWRGEADEAGLRSHCQRLLAPEFVPARVVAVATIARNETGKVDRGQLARNVGRPISPGCRKRCTQATALLEKRIGPLAAAQNTIVLQALSGNWDGESQ